MICTATTTKGQPCRGHAIRGLDRCGVHAAGRNIGRPRLLTDEIADSLVAMLRAGNHVEVAVRAVGLGRATLAEWLARGLSTAPDDAAYRSLRERIESARSIAEARAVAQIVAAGADSWQAAAWFLERSFPDRWARPSQRDLGLPAVPADVTPASDPFAEVDDLAEARRRRGAG